MEFTSDPYDSCEPRNDSHLEVRTLYDIIGTRASYFGNRTWRSDKRTSPLTSLTAFLLVQPTYTVHYYIIVQTA